MFDFRKILRTHQMDDSLEEDPILCIIGKSKNKSQVNSMSSAKTEYVIKDFKTTIKRYPYKTTILKQIFLKNISFQFIIKNLKLSKESLRPIYLCSTNYS